MAKNKLHKEGTAKHLIIKDVRAIRDPKQIEELKWALKRHCSYRDLIIFLIGINTGLRCGDILKLSIADIYGKEEVKIQEGKTKKMRTLYLGNIKEEIMDYVDEELKGKKSKWMFPSRKGDKPISVTHVYRQFNVAAEWVGLKHIGTHTMRKTAAYHMYIRTKNPELIMQMLNHSSWSITRKYVGLTDLDMEEAFKDFRL